MSRHLDCMLRTAELELDIYCRIVSDSVDDFLRKVPDAEDLDSRWQIASWRAINDRRHWLEQAHQIRVDIERQSRRSVPLA